MRKGGLFVSALLMILISCDLASKMSKENEIPTVIRNQLRGFNYFANRAFSLRLLGIDILLDMKGLTLSQWIRPGSTSGVEPAQLIKLNNRSEVSYQENKEIEISKSFTHFTVVCGEKGPVVCGLNFSGYSPGRSRVPMQFESLLKNGSDDFPEAARYDLIREGGFGNLVAWMNREPEALFLLKPDLTVKKKIVLQFPNIVRQVWKISEGKYLVHRFPFFSNHLFSIIDEAGRIKKSFYPIDYSDKENLRAFFMNNFFAVDYAEGKLFVTLVYPKSSELQVDEVDIKTLNIRRMVTEIAGFRGRHPRFSMVGINSIRKGTIAAVNGLFRIGNKVAVSVTLNNKTKPEEIFDHYLFICNPENGCVAVAEIPYGTVIYYDRKQSRFLSLRDHAPGDNSPNFTSFKLGE